MSIGCWTSWISHVLILDKLYCLRHVADRLAFSLSFFLSWVTKTQRNHSTYDSTRSRARALTGQPATSQLADRSHAFASLFLFDLLA